MNKPNKYNNFNCKLSAVTIEVFGIDQELVIDIHNLDLINANSHDINHKSFDEVMEGLNHVNAT